MRNLNRVLVACGGLFLSGVALAHPVQSGEGHYVPPVVLAGGFYTRGDEVVNHGGIAFSSNGLGAWHAGLFSSPPNAASGARIDYDLHVPLFDVPVLIGGESVLAVVPEIGSLSLLGAGPTNPAVEVRALSEPASWALLLPTMLYLGFPRRRIS
jgi:hypothetical protein